MAHDSVEAPLPGKVSKVHVAAGAVIKEGDKLCTIESMKMENPILSPFGGKVIEIKVTAGQLVNGGQVLVIIEH